MEIVDYITDEVKALIGAESERVEATDPVERGQIRRHAQAIMDPDPSYWDAEAAAFGKFGGIVAPPLFVLHSMRQGVAEPDRLAAAASDPDFDGSVRGAMKGLPKLPLPLTRVLNGGNDIELYQQPKPGDRVFIKSRYADISQKNGRSGPMVFLVVETVFTNQRDEILLKSKHTHIIR